MVPPFEYWKKKVQFSDVSGILMSSNRIITVNWWFVYSQQKVCKFWSESSLWELALYLSGKFISLMKRVIFLCCRCTKTESRKSLLFWPRQKKMLKIFSTGCQSLSENFIYFGKFYANRKSIFPHKDELAEMKFWFGMLSIVSITQQSNFWKRCGTD